MRTKNSILNFVTSFLPWLILAILGFLKIKIFINSYGSELNGLVQLANQVFMFLSILSLGFNSAVIYHLYEPLMEKDYNKINNILTASKRYFRIIGVIIFIGGVISSLIIPYIIYKMQISKIFIFLFFLLHAIDYLSTYLLLLPYKVVFEADQKLYVINYFVNLKQLIFRVLELFLISIKFNLLLILLISVILNFIVNKLIIIQAKKTYKWLNLNATPDNSPIKMTKDVFFHRIMKFIFHNTDIMLLSVFKGLKLVSIYGSYNYIIQYLIQLVVFVYRAPQAAIANFIKSKQSSQSKKGLINEYFTVTFILCAFVIPIFIVGVVDFIKIWIDASYVLNNMNIILFGGVLWTEFITYSLFSLIEANGLFAETKRVSLMAAIINLVFSIALIFKFGLSGILFATIMGNILLHFNYSYYLSQRIFNEKNKSFLMKYVINLFLISGLVLINQKISSFFIIKNLLYWLLCYGSLFIVNIVIVIIIYYLIDSSTKKLFERTNNFIKFMRKGKKYEKSNS